MLLRYQALARDTCSGLTKQTGIRNASVAGGDVARLRGVTGSNDVPAIYRRLAYQPQSSFNDPTPAVAP